MPYQVLARKWRPQSFAEVIGQFPITRSLENTVLSDKPGHAYLFSGTRGVGKTTVARIFAKALRCENKQAPSPCGQCKACLDSDSSMNILEMDGASHNSVDDIRDLVDNVQYLPTWGKYKIYIIDEVHMLSSSAFNALLKTLEEPPAHVIFILATTVPEKLLDTVVSRCQHFDFRKVSFTLLKEHLKKVAKEEHIEFTSDQLIELICRQAQGSVRDSLSILEQVLNYATDKKIDEQIVASALGLAESSMIEELLSAILSAEAKDVGRIFRKLTQENVSVQNIITSLLECLFEMVEKSHEKSGTLPMAELFWIFETLAKDSEWIISSPHPEMITEIVLQKIALRRSFFGISQNETPPLKKEPPISPPVSVEQTKSWSETLTSLSSLTPVTVSYLEKGNILEPIKVQNSHISIKLGFPHDGAIFFNYLQDKNISDKLHTNLATVFNCRSEQVDLQLKLLNKKEQVLLNFISISEIEKRKKRQQMDEKKKILINNPLLKQAEQIFNSKVKADNVVLNPMENP